MLLLLFHVLFLLPTPQAEDSTIHPIPTHQHKKPFARSYFILQPYTGDKFLSTEILVKATVCLSHQLVSVCDIAFCHANQKKRQYFRGTDQQY